MKRKTKHKLLTLAVLLVLCLSIILNNQGTVQVCHALASWTPSGGFQPGISATLPDYSSPLLDDTITITNPVYITPTINPDGSLNAYTELKVNNDKRSSTWGGWKYAEFVEYFKVKRTDGRMIYDDDGVLDVSWWKNGNFGYSDEIIDYQSEIWIKTTLMHYNWDGFLGTVLNTKFQSGAYFEVTWDRGEDPEDSLYLDVHDKNANTMGSGNYRNNGVNPGDEYYKLCDWDYCSSPYITITLHGTGYWENGWWGGSYDHTDVYAFMSGFMPRSNRNWSNTLTADSSVVKSGNNLYSPQPFVATATNLNNYIKINGNKVTPIENNSVIPFKEGFKIAIDNDGKTKVSIENGGEEKYTDYYCYVDSLLPDVNFTYLNTNALDNVKENSVQTSSTGVKTQKITGALFKDQVQINFGTTADESPERAYITHNGTTKEIQTCTWLKEDGDYTLVISDAVGHTKTVTFTIDTHSPTANFERMDSDTTFKASKWYLTSLPSEYVNAGTYSYLNYDEALNKAFESEKATLVTSYYLDDVNNFRYPNLVATGDKVKAGNYWYYKAISNPDLYVYYFDENLLNEAIKQYAKNFVSSPQYFNYRTDIFPNDYGTIVDNKLIQNMWNEDSIPAYIANDFTFKKTDNNESYKIYFDYIEDGKNEFIEFAYNKPFKEQAKGHGLYLIKEIDYVGHESLCYVFLDTQAPVLSVTAKIYGEEESFNHTISKNDIPANGELIFYYESFEINEILDDDKWYVIRIDMPDGSSQKYTYVDTLPTFADMPTGEYKITAYDRLGNNFSFKVCMLGKSPKVRFETINANTQLKARIIAGEDYNQIMDIKIFRNDVSLNSELGYDEYPERDDNELIFISITNKEYTFNKGGLYKVQLTDNFGRTTTHEFKFEKDLPQGILKGVKDGGKTNKDVSFIYNATKYIAVVYENDKQISPPSTLDESKLLTTLSLQAKENINNQYKIVLYDVNDFENLNIYKFTIRTTPPEFNLYGVKDGGTTGTDVYAVWEIQNGYSAIYTLNDSEDFEYKNGQVLTNEGVYEITLTDDLGNKNTKIFEIDKTLDFSIYKDNKITTIEAIRYTNKSLQIVANETLNIEILKDNNPYEYDFGTYFNDEGYYFVKIYDEFGNTKYFEFEIDKTNPIASLIGVENDGVTSGFVQVVWDEENLTSGIYRNGNYLGQYFSGSEIRLNGNYVVVVKDLAENSIQFEFKIDNKIEFEINTFRGGISNGGVRVIAKEELTIDMYKNKEKIDYNFEQILNEDGYYEFMLTDILGNQLIYDFYIWNAPIRRIEMALDPTVEIVSILQNEEEMELDIKDNTLYLVDEAQYTVTVFDNSVNKNFSFDLTLDTTPPTILLVGVENGGQTKGEVTTRNASENPIYIHASNNDEEFEYELGDKIKNVGTYKLLVVDEAGNQTEYTFTVIYAFNGATIALFGAMLAVVVILIIFLVKGRKKYYSANTEITTIEETTEEIDNIEEK